MNRNWTTLLLALGIAACAPETADSDALGIDTDTEVGTTGNGGCDYPKGANDVMTLGDVIAPYAWDKATHRSDDRDGTIDLAQVPCAADDDIDWSPFDVLLFVSIPAW